MTTPGSSFHPTPLDPEVNLGVRYHPRGNTSQWRPSRFNFPHPEVGDAAGLGVKPGLTHVLYHDIDTGEKPPVVSRPYRYDRIKQSILDYHIEKMLKEGSILPIQSPYASPVVFCRKNNGLPPDYPEAYRFAVDYRKRNAITNYPRYPLPLIDDLITNIPIRQLCRPLI
ncbi:retrovirus-related Pol polyprotein from transposon 17.6 [Trichonephila clavipes]|nr:retrovirus-related Pol polyprotein from transposon 17.6 [Trichonephila clavipes]